MTNPTCIVDGCEKPSRNKDSAALCKMHYHRQYRHGSVTMVATESGVTASLGRRYLDQHKPDHPLAGRSGKVYVHRMVLFDEIGPGPHTCHWCGAEVDWLPKGHPRSLQPDHLNGDGSDNRLDNLVPSCGPCNTLRGAQARHAALMDAGFWSKNDTISKLKRGTRKPPVRAA